MLNSMFDESKEVKYFKAMFTLYRIAFHAISLSYTVQYEQIFFAVMVSMILK